MVHEGSTIYIGSDENAAVGLDYRRKGVENVCVTGASSGLLVVLGIQLWPW
ncbi:hypothetical protein KSP24_20240 [Paenibacillus sp. AK121]|uniref:hypothetical protein n=1 Tax=Paenibacillus TaxID=44249 RepID=UPI0014856CCB|nr:MULTISPECIES: hypothetical protein [Paenibacillus]MBU9709235.1 hypothetical protein [Paenibacillus sp. AK121]